MPEMEVGLGKIVEQNISEIVKVWSSIEVELTTQMKFVLRSFDGG